MLSFDLAVENDDGAVMSASTTPADSDQSTLGDNSLFAPHPPHALDGKEFCAAVLQPMPDPASPIEIDHSDSEEHADDGDSAVGDDESNLSTSTSLGTSIFNYQYENGRRYHAFRQGQYWLPNDDAEQDRLDLEHHIFRLVLGGMLFRAPIAKNPQRVLDMGTGTGIWALDFADEFPSAVVTGNDLSPIQPSWVSPNCKFIIDDLESEWLYKRSEPFDFIHGRAIAGAIKDWPRLYKQIYEHLKPGGWVEIQEYEGRLRSDDDPELLNAPSVDRWQKLVDEATTIFGQKLNVAGDQKQHMLDAGFVDVADDIYKVPCGRWPQDPKLKNIGMYQQVHLIDCVEPFTLALFKRGLGWSDEEMTVIMAKVKNDFRNKKNYLYTNFHFVYGRKPI